MSNDELNKVELPALEQLKSLGWIYKISLNELDKEVKQSEEVMKKYLEQLGYE